jgi:GT2 family glycosyltransferase
LSADSPTPSGVPRPQLTVVVPTFRNPDLMRRVLDAYERQDAPPDSFELIVVVDPTDPDPAVLDRVIGRRRFAVRRLTGEIPGAAGARNTGWPEARAPVVLFTDDDQLPVPGLVSEHLRVHREQPAESVVCLGRVRWARGLTTTPFMRWLERGVQFDYGSIRGTEAAWAHLYSCNVSFKQSFLARLGGFDAPRFPYGYEDLDIGYRGQEYGLRLIYNERATVDHWREMTLAMWQQKAARIGAGERRFVERHPDVPPTLYRRFREAAALAPQRGRAATLARFVPRWVPYFGPMVWNLADIYWRQQIAPTFIAAFDAEGGRDVPSVAPGDSALSERALEPEG